MTVYLYSSQNKPNFSKLNQSPFCEGVGAGFPRPEWRSGGVGAGFPRPEWRSDGVMN